MCGRYSLSATPQVIGRQFGVQVDSDLKPRYNVPPGTDVLVVRSDLDSGQRLAQQMHWGFTPSWAKPDDKRPRPINARAESVAEKPMFRNAYRSRRCILPADGFYEWKVLERGKQPYFVHPANNPLFGFAGIYEVRRTDDGYQSSCAILTTGANAAMKRIHDRMPVILPPEAYSRWLDPKLDSPAELERLLVAIEAEEIAAYPVSTRVNAVKNDGSELIRPLETTDPH
ncbi:MAG: SOS response-associated peptidase [Burkholderiales bacterium]